MCYIEGPVELMFGHCKRWFDELDDRVAEQAEAAIRARIKAEIDAVTGLERTVSFRDVTPLLSDDLASFLETQGGLPTRAHTLFVDHQLSILNAGRPEEERIWFDPQDPQAKGCCYYNAKREWRPCRTYPLYTGPVDERRPWTITAEAKGLEVPVRASMEIHASWLVTIDDAAVEGDASESVVLRDRAGERATTVLAGGENR